MLRHHLLRRTLQHFVHCSTMQLSINKIYFSSLKKLLNVMLYKCATQGTMIYALSLTEKKLTACKFWNRTISFTCDKFLHHIINKNSSAYMTNHFFHTLLAQYVSYR